MGFGRRSWGVFHYGGAQVRGSIEGSEFSRLVAFQLCKCTVEASELREKFELGC